MGIAARRTSVFHSLRFAELRSLSHWLIRSVAQSFSSLALLCSFRSLAVGHIEIDVNLKSKVVVSIIKLHYRSPNSGRRSLAELENGVGGWRVGHLTTQFESVFTRVCLKTPSPAHISACSIVSQQQHPHNLLCLNI